MDLCANIQRKRNILVNNTIFMLRKLFFDESSSGLVEMDDANMQCEPISALDQPLLHKASFHKIVWFLI